MSFRKNSYQQLSFTDGLGRTKMQDEETTLVADGVYSGKENHDLAAEKNILLVNTDLLGKPVDDILADFVFNEKGTKVLRCPAGYEPRSCGYTGTRSQQFHDSFQRDQCGDCQNKTDVRSGSINVSVQ